MFYAVMRSLLRSLYCSDFHNKKKRNIRAREVFFFRQISTFKLKVFDEIFLSQWNCKIELIFEWYFTYDFFL